MWTVIKAKADDIYLNNISDKMEIRGMTAEDIDIIARGDVSGKDVDSSNLVIRSNGHTGYEDNPLLIHVSGNVDISSAYGEVHYVNSYRKVKPSKKHDKNNGGDQNSGKRPEQETDRKPQQKPSSRKRGGEEVRPGYSESEDKRNSSFCKDWRFCTDRSKSVSGITFPGSSNSSA